MKEEAVYREAQKPVDPLTDGELAFWERMFAVAYTRDGLRWAGDGADRAVEQRRAKFGVR